MAKAIWKIIFQFLITQMNYDSTICLAKRNDDIFPQKTCTGMLITTLFIIEKMESMYSSTCEWY